MNGIDKNWKGEKGKKKSYKKGKIALIL